ncbi:MAG: hypothetical protein KGH71_03975 [Candidatus Micrarchaeota archaeon]|nr:hypothetical protein [Candidatus Micrarchaeota archaeon]
MAFFKELFGKRSFRIDFIAILFFLVVQFILGMTLNLFVPFPTIPAGSADQAYFNAIFSTPYLLAHFIVGFGLLLGSIWILIGAVRNKSKTIIAIAGIGFLSILSAYTSGYEFLLSGFQSNLFSFTMSMGFMAALVCYFALFLLADKAIKKSN